jgi:hypothetical protein
MHSFQEVHTKASQKNSYYAKFARFLKNQQGVCKHLPSLEIPKSENQKGQRRFLKM